MIEPAGVWLVMFVHDNVSVSFPMFVLNSSLIVWSCCVHGLITSELGGQF